MIDEYPPALCLFYALFKTLDAKNKTMDKQDTHLRGSLGYLFCEGVIKMQENEIANLDAVMAHRARN